MLQALEQEGVTHIFGVPGEENEAFLLALKDSNITFVPTRHEQGAAFIANVWGRLTGECGVCLSTLGPGATNLITGLADAHLDKAPVVAITAQGEMERIHHESHQMLDVIDMLRPTVKWNARISEPSIMPEIVRKAFKTARWEKPGVTHIELPENVASMAADVGATLLEVTQPSLPYPATADITKVSSLIDQATKPLILAGNGIIRQNACDQLAAFARKRSIPVATSFMGKGAVPASDALHLGSVGLGFDDYILEAFTQSDLVLCMGYDIAEYDPASWNIGAHKQVIHIDSEIAEVYAQYQPHTEIIADINQTLSELNSHTTKTHDIWWENIAERIDKSIDQFAISGSDTFHAPGVIRLVREALPAQSTLISDVGAHKMWIARNYPSEWRYGSIISNGMASMGIALPGGIAAHMAHPDIPVVCIMGDGGAMMNIQELETAVRMDIKCLYIILNDNDYGLISWKQERSAGETHGTRLGNPSFTALAESFGIEAAAPETASQLETILSEYVSRPRLMLLELAVTTDVNQQLTNQLASYFDQNPLTS